MLVKWDREENGVAATMNLDKARALLEFLNTYAKDEAVTLEAQNAGKDLKVAVRRTGRPCSSRDSLWRRPVSPRSP
jgi:hypothetical protein